MLSDIYGLSGGFAFVEGISPRIRTPCISHIGQLEAIGGLSVPYSDAANDPRDFGAPVSPSAMTGNVVENALVRAGMAGRVRRRGRDAAERIIASDQWCQCWVLSS